jgi:hypothetical protein
MAVLSRLSGSSPTANQRAFEFARSQYSRLLAESEVD